VKWADGEATIHLLLNVTPRAHFFEMVRQWFNFTLIYQRIFSGLLGFCLYCRDSSNIQAYLEHPFHIIAANCPWTRGSR